MKKTVEVNLKLLKDIYELLCSSSKIDWEDEVTSRLWKVLKQSKDIK